MKRAERQAAAAKILEPYLKAKKDRTLLTLGYNRVRPPRATTSLSSVGTETGRYSSSEFIGDPNSTNLQNIAKSVARDDELYQVRDVFLSDPGMVLVGIDYEKAEAVCAAAYSQDWDYLEMILSGDDIHTWHGTHYFSCTEEELTKLQRDIGKMITYASNYMASVWKITTEINKQSDRTSVRVTQEDVTKLRRTYLDLHPMERWWDEVADELDKNDNTLTNALGYTRKFFNPDSQKRLKEALSFLPQSTVASAIRRSLREVFRQGIDRDGEVETLLQIHDELLFQIQEDLVDTEVPRIIEIMERPFEIHGRELYIPAEAQVGHRWGQMKELSA